MHAGRLFGPLADDLEEIPNERALTPRRTRPEFIRVQAVPRTVILSGPPRPEDGPVVEIAEFEGADGQRRAAVVVKQQQSRHEIGEVHLIADEIDLGVRQEVSANRPRLSADVTVLEVMDIAKLIPARLPSPPQTCRRPLEPATTTELYGPPIAPASLFLLLRFCRQGRKT